jgi:hypothetical protein
VWRRLCAAFVVVASLAAVSACSSSSSKSAPANPLQLDMIPAAIKALETQLGGPQKYFEINATSTLVNLFVATDNATKAVAYVYAAKLQAPAAPEAASGPIFTAADVEFDPKTVLTKVLKQLPDSSYRLFAVTGTAAGPAQYVVTVDSSQGGELDVSVTATGDILNAVDP